MQSRSTLAVLSVPVLAGIVACTGQSTTSSSSSSSPSPEEGAVEWSYSGDTGSANWGSLSPDYAACSEGTEQSPVDLANLVTQDTPNPVAKYGGKSAIVLNNGHSILMAPTTPKNTLTISGKKYELNEVHFHSPSENVLNGQPFDAEFHFVHEAADNSAAALGIFVTMGPENPAWQPYIDEAGITNGDYSERIDIEFDELLPELKSTIQFPGSLTTPPCTEGLSWVVNPEPISMSEAQLAELRDAFDGNNRPLQELNGRKLTQNTP